MSPEPSDSGTVFKHAKLRNSCDACSSAKIKCTKEKPACARCAKRGQECTYGASKRTKRSVPAKPSDPPYATAATTTLTTPISATTAETLDTTAASLSMPFTDTPLPPVAAPTPRSSGQTWPDILSTWLSPPGTATPLLPNTSTHDWEQLLSLAETFPGIVTPDWDFSGASVFDPELAKSGGSGSGNDQIVNKSMASRDSTGAGAMLSSGGGHPASVGLFPSPSLLQAASASIQTPPASSSSSRSRSRIPLDPGTSAFASSLPSSSTDRSLDSPCHCFPRTLSSLARLSPTTPEACINTNDNDSPSQLPVLEQVMAQNEEMINQVGVTLQCPCSNNGYLLFLLSLVIFKILAWYTAALNAIPGEGQDAGMPGSGSDPARSRPKRVMPSSLTSMVSSESEGEDQRRIAAQLILSKLSGVQALMDQLSQRLATVQTETRHATASVGGQESLSSVQEESMFALPFSATMVRTLETDLRDRLHGLSRAITEKLRPG